MKMTIHTLMAALSILTLVSLFAGTSTPAADEKFGEDTTTPKTTHGCTACDKAKAARTSTKNFECKDNQPGCPTATGQGATDTKPAASGVLQGNTPAQDSTQPKN